MLFDPGVLHINSRAKYAAAFLRNTLRRRLLKDEAELRRAPVQLLDDWCWLERLVAQEPGPDDGVAAWFEPRLASKLEKA